MGKDVTEEFIEKMLNEATGPVNFTKFLTLFGKEMVGTDSEDIIKNAFQCFDENNSGKLVVFISYLLDF